MSSKIATHLSSNALKDLMTNPGKKMTVVLQVKQWIEKSMNKRKMVMAVISDGFFYAEFIIYPQIADKFSKEVKPNDILEISAVVRDKSKNLKLLYEFKKIYGDVGELIGAPIPFPENDEETAVNPHGSNEIPQSLFLDHPEEEVTMKEMDLLVNDGAGERKVVVAPVEKKREMRDSDEFYLEIANLTIYERGWKVKGRIIKKTPLREFVSRGKPGCVFNIVILDRTRTIQGSFFGDVARKFYDMLQEGKVYSFSDGIVKNATKFNSTGYKYEISFTDRSNIEEKPDDPSIPGFSFRFVTIKDIINKNQGTSVDLICVVDEIGDVRMVNLKNGEQKEVRDIVLKDDSQHKITLTLWGDATSKFKLEQDSIIILQAVTVNDYNGKRLSFFGSSTLLTKIPELKRYKELLSWRNSARNKTGDFTTLNEEREIKKMKLVSVRQMINSANQLYDSEEGSKMFFTVIVHLATLSKNPTYDACSNDNCKKKLIPNTYGGFECPKCNKTFEQAKPRFFSSCKFEDSTGSFFGSVGGEEFSKKFTGKDADELKAIVRQGDHEYFEFCKQVRFREFKLRVKATKSYYNSEERIRFHVIQATNVMDSAKFFCNEIIKMMSKMRSGVEV